MADSHDNLPFIDKAIAAFESTGREVVLHCGDFIAPFAVKKMLQFKGRVVGVFGNNDGEKTGIRKLWPEVFEPPHLFELGGRRVMAVHDVAAAPESPDVDVVAFGHSHEKSLQPGPPLIVNPGETGGWLGNPPTVAVLDTETMQVDWIDL